MSSRNLSRTILEKGTPRKVAKRAHFLIMLLLGSEDVVREGSHGIPRACFPVTSFSSIFQNRVSSPYFMAIVLGKPPKHVVFLPGSPSATMDRHLRVWAVSTSLICGIELLAIGQLIVHPAPSSSREGSWSSLPRLVLFRVGVPRFVH